MRVEYIKEGHNYICDGEVASYSVTEILKLAGIAPDYSNVSSNALDKARARGVKIHAEIERALKGGDALSPEAKFVKNFFQDKNVITCSEVPIGMKYKGVVIGGTIDILAIGLENGNNLIADTKATSRVDIDYVSWQTSLYDYMLRKEKQEIMGTPFEWNGAKEFFCFSFPKGKDGKDVELKKVPDEDIEKMLDAVLGQKSYEKTLSVPQDFAVEFERLETALANIQKQEKEAKAKVEEMRLKLLQAMEEQGVYSFEGERVKVSYRRASVSEKIDADKVRAFFPEVYDQCKKQVPTRASVIVKIKRD